MMNIRILWSILCLLLVFVPGAWGQDQKTVIIDRIQEEYERTQDIYAAFTQISLK